MTSDAFDAFSSASSSDSQQPKSQSSTAGMPLHYAWLAVNPQSTHLKKEALKGQWLYQKHQQSLIERHGLNEDEIVMMRKLKQALQEDTQSLMSRITHWLEIFDPSLKTSDIKPESGS